MKKVLIITYHFPPRPTIGGLRLKGLAKHLPEFGWEPIILTPAIDIEGFQPYRIIRTPYNELGVNKILGGKKNIGVKDSFKKLIGVKRNKKGKMFVDYFIQLVEEIIAYPDPQKGWYEYAVTYGDLLFQKEKIDAIISSSKPETSHLIANKLQKQFDVPWVADFRDLWTQNHYYSYSFIRRFREKRLELKTIRNANALVTISEPLAKKLEVLHGKKNTLVIQNGFDPEEINIPITKLTKKFTITYTGSFYKGRRDPSMLYKAIHDLIIEKYLDESVIEIRFFGPKEDWMNDEIKKYGLQDVVIECGTVSRNISLEKQRESQLLLLLLWDHPEEIGVFTGKIFEYLAAQRPVLAIGGPEGVVKDLLNETGVGAYATSVDDIKKILIRCYDEYKLNGNVSYKGNEEKINNYSQREMARKFSMVLNNITKKHS